MRGFALPVVADLRRRAGHGLLASPVADSAPEGLRGTALSALNFATGIRTPMAVFTVWESRCVHARNLSLMRNARAAG
jgi:hypothetical protein